MEPPAMPLIEHCTVCSTSAPLDYDVREWQADGDCDRCGGPSKWELRAAEGSGAEGEAELARALELLRQQEEEAALSSPQASASPQRGGTTAATSPGGGAAPSPASTRDGTTTTDAESNLQQLPRDLPEWLPRSDWSDVLHCRGSQEEPAEYAAERPPVSVEDLRRAYTAPDAPRELAVNFRYQNSHQDWEAADQEYRRWAKYIDNVDEARWRVDREAVVAALPHPVQQRCKPADFAAIAEVRRVMIISDSLRPLTDEEVRQIRTSYDAGCDIVPLASQWRRPPMLLMKALLKGRGGVPDDALQFKLWRMPARFLGNDRDVRQVYACAQRDTVASPEQCWEQRERRRMAEKVFVRWLEKGRLRFWVRQQLPKEMPAPFCLLLDVLRVNGGPIMWVELFDLYGVDGTATADLIDRRVASLEDRWGHGLVLFLAGHSPGMGSPGRWRKSIAVDPRELNPQLRELVTLTQTARLDQLREGLKYEMARVFEGTGAESHYAHAADTPLPSAPAPSARAVPRGGVVKEEDGEQDAKRRRKGGRMATAGIAKGYRQVWDGAEREAERIRGATGAVTAPPGAAPGAPAAADAAPPAAAPPVTKVEPAGDAGGRTSPTQPAASAAAASAASGGFTEYF